MAGIQFNARTGLSVGQYGTVIDASGAGTLTSLTLSTPLAAASGGMGSPITGIVKGNGSSYAAAVDGTDFVSPNASTTYTVKQTFAAASSVVSGSINIPNNSVSNTPTSGDLYGNASGLNWHNGTSNKLLAYADGTNISGTLAVSISGNSLSSTTATNLAGGGAGRVPYQTGSGSTAFTSTSGTAGQLLQSNGGATPTWVDASTLTVANAANISGIAAIVNGGTGASSPTQALTNLLPSGGSSSWVLSTNGSGAFYWAAQTGVNSSIGTYIQITKLTYVVGFGGIVAGQTIFTAPTYVAGAGQLKVFINGIRQFDSQYVETNATTVTLNNGVGASDTILIEVDGYSTWTPIALGIGFTPSGSVTATDVQNAIGQLDVLKAPINSPTFTGIPRAVTTTAADNSTKIATTFYVDRADNLKANIASPLFTGNPQAPTPLTADNSISIATTAYVKSNLSSYALTSSLGTGATANISLYATLLSPALTGTPTAPTNPTASTSTTQIATTAFTQAAIDAKASTNFNHGYNNVAFPATNVWTQNTTGYPMLVSVDNYADNYGGGSAYIYVSNTNSGGIEMASAPPITYVLTNMSTIVPASKWYKITHTTAQISAARFTW